MREVGRGWQPSVRSVRPWDSAGCQSQDSWEKMEYTLSLVSCRSTLTGLPLQLLSISTSPLLLSPLFFSPLFFPLAAVCLCVLCKKRAEKKNREESGGRVASTYNRLPGDSIVHKEFPEAFIPRFTVRIYLLTCTEDLFAITQHNDRPYVLLIAYWASV